MEKIYYKGKIVEASKLQCIEISLGNFKNHGISKTADDFLNFLNPLDDKIITKLKDELIETKSNEISSLSNPIFDPIRQEINHLFMQEYQNLSFHNIDIIFETITAKNGDLYGKELITGLLFPIISLNKIKYKILHNKLEGAVKKEDSDEIIFLDEKSINSDYYVSNLHVYNYTYKAYNYNKKITLRTYYNANAFYSEGSIKYEKLETNLLYFNIIPILSSFENLSLYESIIFNFEIANINEINEYKNSFKGISKLLKQKKKFIERLNTLYNKNVFNSAVEEKEERKETKYSKIQKDQISLKLENIEYLLAVLKQKDIETYKKFLKQYNEMILSEEETMTLNPLTIENLSVLESQIELYINYSKNNVDNILELLNNLKQEYLDNFLNDKEKTTKLTILDIDKISELFLKTKSKYSIKDQQVILKSISFLYIMEIIEDQNIKAADLEDSYFKDNLKYIMITILQLIEDDIIENNFLIDYEKELDLYTIFNIIKNIEFKKNKVKTKK